MGVQAMRDVEVSLPVAKGASRGASPSPDAVSAMLSVRGVSLRAGQHPAQVGAVEPLPVRVSVSEYSVIACQLNACNRLARPMWRDGGWGRG